MEESESLKDKSDDSCVLCFQQFFLSRFLLLDFLQLLSVDKSGSLNNDSDNDGSDSGSTGTCASTFNFEDYVVCVENSVGRVDDSVGCFRVMGCGVFVSIGIN